MLPGYWVNQMKTMNESVGEKNLIYKYVGGKRPICPFTRNKFWKCIGCILSTVTYGNKGQNIWSEIPKDFGNMENPKLRRDVRVNTDLYKVCCAHYCNFYIYACH